MMGIGERCVITMLIVRLLMSHADNLGIVKVRCDANERYFSSWSTASAFPHIGIVLHNISIP